MNEYKVDDKVEFTEETGYPEGTVGTILRGPWGREKNEYTVSMTSRCGSWIEHFYEHELKPWNDTLGQMREMVKEHYARLRKMH